MDKENVTVKSPKKRARFGKIGKNDIERLRGLTRAMLTKLEAVLDSNGMVMMEESQGQPMHEWLFGTKQSLASTLVVLAELMLKLQQMKSEAEPGAPLSDMPLGEGDVVLIEEFLRKIKAKAQ